MCVRDVRDAIGTCARRKKCVCDANGGLVCVRDANGKWCASAVLRASFDTCCVMTVTVCCVRAAHRSKIWLVLKVGANFEFKMLKVVKSMLLSRSI